MKKSLAALLLVAPLSLGLSGCIVVATDGEGDFSHLADHEEREYENRKKIARLQVGMEYSATQDLLGVPDFTELYEKDGENIQVLFYRTNRKHSDSMTTKDECTPLVFKDGKLAAWGESAYSEI
ncbi:MULTISPECIES: DUF3192 domain-containing protein [unclassified Thalassotalea]|uniref:DUF3192 domain-containing protein n=1 Tax=unclassified Thalassotalea TaxID=2614972 RepID=UPI0010815A52|nr:MULTISPECIES: DUF3192 domain-containing protein [unclassified Thalassotalea]NMP16433.1 DUF3192 domain-containing protein [Thalassotalea sp. Y01]QBY03198.1 DUF3192 domain-containing protein [Thalassotalea sp. HSM 43]